MLFGSTLCQLMEQLQPKMGNPLAFFRFSLVLLILCYSNVSENYYHDTESYELSTKYKE